MAVSPIERRLERINTILENLDALNLPASEQAALRARLERLDDNGLFILDEGIQRVVARCKGEGLRKLDRGKAVRGRAGEAGVLLDHEPDYKTRIVPDYGPTGEVIKWRVVDIANKRTVAEGTVPIVEVGRSIAWQKAADLADKAMTVDRLSAKVKPERGGKAVKTDGQVADNGRLAL